MAGPGCGRGGKAGCFRACAGGERRSPWLVLGGWWLAATGIQIVNWPPGRDGWTWMRSWWKGGVLSRVCWRRASLAVASAWWLVAGSDGNSAGRLAVDVRFQRGGGGARRVIAGHGLMANTVPFPAFPPAEEARSMKMGRSNQKWRFRHTGSCDRALRSYPLPRLQTERGGGFKREDSAAPHKSPPIRGARPGAAVGCRAVELTRVRASS